MSLTTTPLLIKTGAIWPKKLINKATQKTILRKQSYRHKFNTGISLHQLKQINYFMYPTVRFYRHTLHTTQFNYLIIRNHLLNNFSGLHPQRKVLPHYQGCAPANRYLQLL